MSSSIQGHLPSKVVLHQRFSFIKGPLLSKVHFHQMSSSIKDHLPPKVLFPQRLSFIEDKNKRQSSIKGCHPLQVILHQRVFFIKRHLPSKFILHQRSSSIKCHLPSINFFFHRRTFYIKLSQCAKFQTSSLFPARFWWGFLLLLSLLFL